MPSDSIHKFKQSCILAERMNWEKVELDSLESTAQSLLEHCKSDKIFAFYGEMGTGKTTFIKTLCKILGVSDEVSSPTYSIVNEYHGTQTVYHFDLYRLKDENELLDIGFSEYLNSGKVCLIEWPQLAEPFLFEHVSVKLSLNDDNSRSISISK